MRCASLQILLATPDFQTFRHPWCEGSDRRSLDWAGFASKCGKIWWGGGAIVPLAPSVPPTLVTQRKLSWASRLSSLSLLEHDQRNQDWISQCATARWQLLLILRPLCSVPTDRRSFRTGLKKILEDRSVQDLKISKRTSKDLFFDPGTIIRFRNSSNGTTP